MQCLSRLTDGCLELIPLPLHRLQLSAAANCTLSGADQFFLKGFALKPLRLELLSELLQSLIGLEKPLLKKLPLCMTISTTRTEHRAAQDKAGDQASENPGDE